MNKTIIIGSGFSSAVLNKKLNKKNNILIFDKSRGPGGRSSTRRVENIGFFDHGLQFISPKSQEFSFFLNQHLSSSIKNWKGDFLSFEENKKINKKKYIGKLGNNDFVKDLMDKNVNYLKELLSIKRNKNEWVLLFKDKSIQECKQLILTIPSEQCQKIVKSLNLNLNFNGKMQPNLTVMIAFKKNLGVKLSGIKFEKNSILGWAANESSKLRIGNNENFELWTLQSSLDFADKYCLTYKNKKEEVMKLMINEFITLLKIKNIDIVHKDIHGWLYAYKNNNFTEKFYWNNETKLGICGDWMCGSKAEDAWSSATLLANQINNS